MTSAAGATRRQQRIAGLLFVTPFVILLVAFLLLPLAYALRLSLYRSTLVQGDVFSAAANYQKAITDPQFLSGVRRVVVFGLVQTPVMILLALIAALVVDSAATRFARAFRLAAFVPYAVPAVIGTLMWGFLYSPGTGPLHSLLHVDFLSGAVVLFSLGNVTTWMWAGYNMIVMYAALQGVPPALYESARVDGASAWQIGVRIKVPMISSAIVLCTVFTIVGTLQFFTEPLLLQPLNPGTITTYFTPNLYAFNLAFSYQQYNYSAAISFLLGAVVFIGSYVFLFITRRRSALQ